MNASADVGTVRKVVGLQSTDIRPILITNFYRCTVHFDIYEVHTSTNALVIYPLNTELNPICQ